jgi:50S ribosomal protein L16 3-hydroxylase
MKNELLGGLSPRNFLRDYWHKKPLLVRGALPGFQGLLTSSELIELACREDAQSRLITRKNGKWQLRQGPFAPHFFSRLPKKQWTLLVQDVNHFLPAARELLLRFNFIPHSRLDDLMVSFAPPGGGVGPHFDSYDVFLLQGMGRRCWQISAQRDKGLIVDAPIKILQKFTPDQEWLLEPGDMLYLPPGYAHNGVAENNCMTYSIGFRAPSHQELTTQFLVHLQDQVAIEGMYRDPDISLQSHPARISSAMVRQVGEILDKIKWDRNEVERFIGTYLTEPKPHVFFTPPASPLSQKQFEYQVRKNGLQLDLKSRMLRRRRTIFLNGDGYSVKAPVRRSLEKLADGFMLPAVQDLDEEAFELCYQWYLCGYIEISAQPVGKQA